MRLTYELFSKLSVQYVFGINTDDYCARRYVHAKSGITKEVVTPRKIRGDIYSGFGEPDICYYMSNSPVYPTAQALYEGEFLTPWFRRVDPHRPGWYETDQGMLFFTGTPGIWYLDLESASRRYPNKWRGMKDVPVNPHSTESNA